jgi:hypothetical protein
VPKRRGGAITHRTVNKQAGQRRQERWHTLSNLVEGKLVKVAVGGKLHRRGGSVTSHVNSKQTCWPEKVGVAPPSPRVLRKEKACNSGNRAQENSK